MRLSEKLLRGSTLNLLDMALKTAATFVMMPLMKTRLGMESWGTWLLVISMVNWFALLDAGATFAGTRFLAAAWGKSDEARAATVLLLIRRYFFGVAVFIFAASTLLILIGEFYHGFPERTTLVIALTGLCSLAIGVRFALREGPVTLRARVRYDVLACISMIRVALQNGLMAWVLLTNCSLWLMAAVFLACETVEVSLQWLASRWQNLPSVELADSALLPTLGREMRQFSVLMVLAMASETLRLGVSPMLVASLAGVATVPVFSIGMRLLTMIEDVVNALFGGQLMAAFSHLKESDGQETMNRQFLRVCAMASGFTTFALAGAALYGRAFLNRLLGTEMTLAHDVFLILVPGFLFRLMQYPANCALYSMGRQMPLLVMTLISAAIGSALCLPFAQWWGVRGIAAAFGTEMLVCYLVAQPWIVARTMKIRLRDYYRHSLLVPSVLTMIPLLLFGWIMQRWLKPDFGVLTIASLGHCIVFAVSAPWISLGARDRHSLFAKLASLRRK